MAFIPLTDFEGKQMELPATNATTFYKNKLVKFSSGYLTNAAAADDVVGFLCLEDVVTTATGQLIKVLPIDMGMRFQALTGTTPVQATHCGNYYDLTDDATIDLTGTTDKVFQVEKIVDATNKLVEGRFWPRE